MYNNHTDHFKLKKVKTHDRKNPGWEETVYLWTTLPVQKLTKYETENIFRIAQLPSRKDAVLEEIDLIDKDWTHIKTWIPVYLTDNLAVLQPIANPVTIQVYDGMDLWACTIPSAVYLANPMSVRRLFAHMAEECKTDDRIITAPEFFGTVPKELCTRYGVTIEKSDHTVIVYDPEKSILKDDGYGLV